MSLVAKLRRRHRHTGAVAPQPHTGGQKQRWESDAEMGLHEAVRTTPAGTLEALYARVAHTPGSRVRIPTMCQPLQQ